MEYRRHEPAPRLTGLVEHYWSVIEPAPPAPLRAVLVPDGRATIQLCLGRPGRRFTVGGPAQENADVYLPTGTQPFVIEQEGPSHYVGIQFTPWGARTLFPGAPEHPAQIQDVLGPLPGKPALAVDPARELDRWLDAFLPAVVPTAPDLLAAATERIDADPAAVEVGALPAALAVSSSTLYRTFRRGIGLSPKQYVQVMRHRAFTDALLAGTGGVPTALVASLSGYADQPHAAREFTRFTGMTTTAFRDTYDGIARLMARSG
ncbi:helix-turn-helix domain-containing protein [Actinotalea sp. K2]|uniref:AraC family transcriptional regulator n=1 Tax=Actinotalea sp. K2 TaxID=2939438 RepID=UPI0020175D47|nr:helix-turn-helix domain-containing protein [Actinotalea sp. K2]MCL3861004.1 helix-turn-helix domain-containing protein [Actinotalea sp. K2]